MIAERPQVDAELREMRSTHHAVLYVDRPTEVTKVEVSAPNGIYHATREWIVDANAKCAADRALSGKIEEERQQPAFIRWLKHLF